MGLSGPMFVLLLRCDIKVVTNLVWMGMWWARVPFLTKPNAQNWAS